jgi:hypothetical protein
MGLSITAWQRVELAKRKTLEEYLRDDDRPEGTQFLYPVPRAPDMAERTDGLEPGYYRCSDEKVEFSVGSYSHYNRWREKLARLVLDHDVETICADLERFKGKPFFELIYFADNEGFIGPVTSAKLAQDFADYADRVAAAEAPESDFRETYGDFWSAFAMAAVGQGVVKFH